MDRYKNLMMLKQIFMDQFASKMISDHPWEDDEVDRQIISMLYDAEEVGSISSGNYWGVFLCDNNKYTQENGDAGDQFVMMRQKK